MHTVTIHPTQLDDYERARAWRAPATLRFALLGAPRVGPTAIELEAELVNEGDEAVEVIVFPAYLHLDLVDVCKRPSNPPMPAPAPPPPSRFELPPRSRTPFRAVLMLADYDFASGTRAELEWSFTYWTPPYPRGRATVVLP